MARLLIDESSVSLERSADGVATSSCSPHESGDGVWIGWPRDVASLDAARLEGLHRRLAALRLVSVRLSTERVERSYEGFSRSCGHRPLSLEPV